MTLAASTSSAHNAGIVVDMDRNWQCNSCGKLHVTRATGQVVTPMHQCASHAGTWVPFVPAHDKGVLRIEERQDYIGPNSSVLFDANGRAIMSVYTQRDDGEDVHIHAPCIHAKITELDN